MVDARLAQSGWRGLPRPGGRRAPRGVGGAGAARGAGLTRHRLPVDIERRGADARTFPEGIATREGGTGAGRRRPPRTRFGTRRCARTGVAAAGGGDRRHRTGAAGRPCQRRERRDVSGELRDATMRASAGRTPREAVVVGEAFPLVAHATALDLAIVAQVLPASVSALDAIDPRERQRCCSRRGAARPTWRGGGNRTGACASPHGASCRRPVPSAPPAPSAPSSSCLPRRNAEEGGGVGPRVRRLTSGIPSPLDRALRAMSPPSRGAW